MMKRMIGCIQLLAILSVPLAAAAASGMAQEKGATPEELTRGSDVVAVGTVRELKAEWTSGKRSIVTRVTLSVDEYLKGSAGQTMTIVVPGGEVDGVGELYSHTARFKKEQDVVLFAKKHGGSELRLTGGERGKLEITKDSQSGRRVVAGGMSLDDFKQRVKNTR